MFPQQFLYNPYSNSSIPAPAVNPYMPASKQDIIKVNGENGAKAYQMAPNSSALLLDETQPVIWLKQTDGAGYPSLNAYSITPYAPEVPVNTSELERRISRLEGIISESYITNAAEPETTECVVADPADKKFNKWKKS
ncbi:MAG: hypothetical protein MJZ03_05600 [archaeon]|jgi:hypothetical protein|nr:hypothetical protein [archaeon]